MNPFGEYAALRRFTRNLHQSRFGDYTLDLNKKPSPIDYKINFL